MQRAVRWRRDDVIVTGSRVTCVVLAAGIGSRMRDDRKLLLPIEGRSLLARALDATAGRPTVVVVSPSLSAHVPAVARRSIVVNDAPELGMTHSLRLAVAALPDDDTPLAVLLADTPYVDGDLLERVLAALGDADVAHPVRAGIPGHPVVFGPRPRRALAQLPPGDTLRILRDDPRWRRVALPVEGDAPFVDVDTPDDYRRAQARG